MVWFNYNSRVNNGGINILGTIKVKQTSNDLSVEHTDALAEKIKHNDYVRFTYMEENGAYVTLDIMDDTVSLRRRDKGMTHGTFKLNEKTELRVINEHGDLVFDVNLVSLDFDGSNFEMKYKLIHLNIEIDQHQFQLNWNTEE